MLLRERWPPPASRFWVLEDSPSEWLDCAHGARWPFGCEHGLEQSKDLLDGPKQGREYYEYRLFDEGVLVKHYLNGEAALHVHLRGLPLQGKRSPEGPTADFCVVLQRAPFAAAEVVRVLVEL